MTVPPSGVARTNVPDPASVRASCSPAGMPVTRWMKNRDRPPSRPRTPTGPRIRDERQSNVSHSCYTLLIAKHQHRLKALIDRFGRPGGNKQALRGASRRVTRSQPGYGRTRSEQDRWWWGRARCGTRLTRESRFSSCSRQVKDARNVARPRLSGGDEPLPSCRKESVNPHPSIPSPSEGDGPPYR